MLLTLLLDAPTKKKIEKVPLLGVTIHRNLISLGMFSCLAMKVERKKLYSKKESIFIFNVQARD